MRRISDKERLNSLSSYKLVDTSPEKDYDDLTKLAALICDTPVALVSLITDTRQFFKSHYGVEIQETHVEHSFCARAITSEEEIFIIEDARVDERFKNNPLVTDKLNIVFYAGVPLIDSSGFALGSFCIIDKKPRVLTELQIETLRTLANQVVQLFELRKKRLELGTSNSLLSKESKRLSNIIEATNVGTWEWDVRTDEVVINERWAEMVGYTLKELEPIDTTTWKGIVHPDDLMFSDLKVAECFNKKSRYYDIECRLIHKNGSIVWVNDRGQVTEWTEDGEPLKMAGTHTDITGRKLREAQFMTVTNNIPGAVFRYTLFPDGKDALDSVTKGAYDLWGFSPEQIMRDSQLIWDGVDEDFLQGMISSIKESAENNSKWEYEWRYHHPDGSIKWHRGSGLPISRSDGSTIWNVITLDITDQKQVQIGLELSEQRFKALVQEGSDLIAILDMEANYQYVSPTSSTVLGIAPEDFIGKNVFDFIHPEDKATVFETFEKLEKVKQVSVKPFRFKNNEGSWRWIETVITNLIDDPSVRGVIANSRDVTDRIEFDLRMQESEQKYADLFHFSPQPMWLYDLNSLKFLDVNQAAITHYGYTYEEFMELTLRDIRPEEDIQTIEMAVEKVRNSSEKHSQSTRIHSKKNGEQIIVELRGSRINFRGKPAELILVTDVTQLNENIVAIEKQNAKLKKIAWTQSHVVRAPLASLIGLVDLLKHEKEDQSEKNKILDLIAASASELDSIVREVVATTVES